MTASGALTGTRQPPMRRKRMPIPPRAVRPVLSMFGFTAEEKTARQPHATRRAAEQNQRHDFFWRKQCSALSSRSDLTRD